MSVIITPGVKGCHEPEPNHRKSARRVGVVDGRPILVGCTAPGRRRSTTSHQRIERQSEKNAQLSALIAEIRSQADAFVFLSGGASKMREDHQRQLLAMFEALALVAKAGRRIAVGDGGTRAGIMEAAGHAAAQAATRFR